MYALVDEGVLYRPVAEQGVMYDQIMHLVEMSQEPNITIQVVPPFGPPRGSYDRGDQREARYRGHRRRL